MIISALDSNSDWTFGKGLNNYLSGNAAVGQNIYSRIRSFLGDCFFDLSAGIDWFNLLGGKNQVAIENAIRAVILGTEDVNGVVELSAHLDENRLLTVSYQVSTFFSGAVGKTIRFLLTEEGLFLTTEDGDRIIL